MPLHNSTGSRLVTLAFLIAVAGCQPRQKQSGDQLGTLDFQATGNEAAQPAFKKGMLLLHSFEYEDAAEAFRNAIHADTGFVMAYWGEAMTETHPLWQEQEYDKGSAILQKLAPEPEARVALAKTEMEKDFIKGVNIIYGTGNKSERDSLYALHMEHLYNKYPGHDEVAAFYSLSLIGWGLTDLSPEIMEKAARIAGEVTERNPNHPGALHYAIHANDNPKRAARALVFADKYAKVAPDAGHALHMPTHTYVALGLWDKVVSSNIVSWAAEKARKERKKLDNDALGYHAYHWLQYGYLQQGNFPIARLMLDSINQYCKELPSSYARTHLIYLKTTYIAETNDFDKKVLAINADLKDLNITTRAQDYFVRGMAAYHSRDEEALNDIIRKITGERLIEEARASDKGLRVCGNINRSLPSVTDLLETKVMECELKAMQAWLKKDAGTTEKYMQEATVLQTESGYSEGPPTIVKPSFEMYGEWLLDNNRPVEAKVQFEAALRLHPNKTTPLKGIKEAEEKIKSLVSR